MNTLREAIYESAAIESFKLKLRWTLQMLLAVTAAWVEFSVILVWYWTGRDSGPAAHQYFFEWFIAWFLTQVIPLTFASLPYRGGQYTVTSMCRFLNAKYYLGASLAQWYWNCALAGAALTAALVAASGLGLQAWDHRHNFGHLRGVMPVPVRNLAKRLRAMSGVWLAGVRVPRQLESQHFLILGSTGSGKSVAIRSLLRQVEARGQVAVVVDPEGEFVAEFYRPERGDYVLNPRDSRCPELVTLV